MAKSGITMGGLATGLDIYGMAKQMALIQTQAKKEQLNKKETSINSEVKALEKLSSGINDFYNALNKFSTPNLFGTATVKMDEDDKKLIGVTVDKNAIPNSYQLQVNQLATQSKVEVLSVSSSTGKMNPDQAGQYSFTVDGKTMTFNVSEGDSLGELVKQINESPDNGGMTASIINSGDRSFLMLTSKKTGEAAEITVSSTAATFTPAVRQQAQDAGFTLDGIRLTSPDNTVDDVVDGVSLELKKISDGPVRVEIESDTKKMNKSVSTLVDAYNNLIRTIDDLTKTTTDEKGNRKASPLTSDSMVSSLKSELRNIMQGTFDGPYSSFTALGITAGRDGKLGVDASELKNALKAEPDNVTSMFMELIENWQNLATSYIGRPEAPEKDESKDGKSEDDTSDNAVSTGPEKYISAKGLIDDRINGLKEQERGVGTKMTALKQRYDEIYKRYLDEYIAMDLAVQQMNSTMSSLLV